MADGDIVHGVINRPYIDAYKWICEGKATVQECCRKLLTSIKKDLTNKGDMPVALATALAACFTSDSIQALNQDDLSKRLEQITQKTQGPTDWKELVLNAAKDVLHKCKYDGVEQIANFKEAIFRCYLQRVYECGFKARISVIAEHHQGATRADVLDRMRNVQPEVNATLAKWSKDLAELESVSKLRLPRRPNIKPIDLEEDLL